MDGEHPCVRPSDVFSGLSDTNHKSPLHAIPHLTWDHEEKFRRYDSSPESVTSYSDDNTYSPVDERPCRGGRNPSDLFRQYLIPYQTQLGSFTTTPAPVDSLREDLLSTYLTNYAEDVYCFSPAIRPHPMGVILARAMTNPACFHLVLARSAQYRLHCQKFQTRSQQQELEFVLMEHRGEALQLIRSLSGCAVQVQQVENLMASIVSLGLLDQHSGATDVASVHLGAARQLLRSIGGPSQFQSLWLSRLMAHFECGYGSTTDSFIWDRGDFAGLHTELNAFFSQVWSIQNPNSSKISVSRRSSLNQQRIMSNTPEHSRLLGLRIGSVLHDCLSQRLRDPLNPTQQDRSQLVFQLTCLLLLSAILVDHQTDPEGLESYIDSVHELIITSQLRHQSVNNIMWLLQIHDHSDMHSRRVWQTAGWVWILRHVNFNVQGMVRDWLLAILTGQAVSRPLKLDAFAFSYAS